MKRGCPIKILLPIDRYPQLSNLSTHIAINRPIIKYRTMLVLPIVFFVVDDKVAEIGKYLDTRV